MMLMMADYNSKQNFGYPHPGPQHISLNKSIKPIDNAVFVPEEEWATLRDFEYVIIGSSFCALSFTHRMLKNNRNAKILIIERGDCIDPDFLGALPPLNLTNMSKEYETFHWKVSQKTHNGEHIKHVRGMNNFFGGRSLFWKAWSPKPEMSEMAGWPHSVACSVQDYFPDARELLNVQPVNAIPSVKDGSILQSRLYEALNQILPPFPITRVDHAPLSIQKRCGVDQKFSVLSPLLACKREAPGLKVMIRCLVKKIHHKEGRAISLETEKGVIPLGDAKLILAMGTLPPTTLMLNSFPSLGSIGKRFTAHFISNITARIPSSVLLAENSKKRRDKLEIGAVYAPGVDRDSKHQFHIQLTAVNVQETTRYDSMRHILKAPKDEQLASSEDHVIFVCTSLGQLDHNNAENWFCLNKGSDDITCNATLQVVANDKDNALWDTMDATTFEILEQRISRAIEYWNPETKKWQAHRPLPGQIREPGVVHPASTMWIGETESSPVDLDYRFRGVDNVYLTGGALWPTGASWNPTCTMSALAMHLADKLCHESSTNQECRTPSPSPSPSPCPSPSRRPNPGPSPDDFSGE